MPGGTGLQTADVDRGVVGDPIGAEAARISREGEGGSRCDCPIQGDLLDRCEGGVTSSISDDGPVLVDAIGGEGLGRRCGCPGSTVERSLEALNRGPSLLTGQRQGEGAVGGDAIAVAESAVNEGGAKGHASRVGGAGGVNRGGRRKGAVGADVADRIRLANLDRVGGIGALGQDEAAAAAVLPSHTTVGAVLPGGTGFQAAHVHRAIAGDAVGGGGTRIRRQGQRGRGRQGIDDDAIEAG